MTATISPVAEALIKNFGYADVNEFVIAQSRKILKEKIKEKQDKIAFYEQKYSLTYEEFIARAMKMDKNDPILSKFGLIEKEDDDFDWEDALRFYEIYSKRLNQSYGIS